MFAIIETGGKQYKVAPRDKVTVELLDAEAGAEVIFDKVLLISEGEDIKVGKPAVDGARVTAKVVEQTRGDKVVAFKKRRRKDSKKKIGHRQHLTVVEITAIQA